MGRSPGARTSRRAEGARPDTASGRTKGSAAPRSPGPRPRGQDAQEPAQPSPRRPCAQHRTRASSPPRGPRRSPSGASRRGIPQPSVQAGATDGDRHREPTTRRAQPSRPPRARADCASPGLRAPSGLKERPISSRRPRSLTGVVVRTWGAGLGFGVRSRERAGGIRVSGAVSGAERRALGSSLPPYKTWSRLVGVRGHPGKQAPDRSVHLPTSGSVRLGRESRFRDLGDFLELRRL